MSKVLKWLDNYWYHYKWHTLIVAFFAAVLVILTVQMATKDRPDVMILYGGPVSVNADQRKELESAVELIMSQDFNGDGEYDVMITDIELITDAQLLAAQKEAAEKGEEFVFKGDIRAQNEKDFNTNVMMGQHPICLLDPYWYDLLKQNGRILELEAALGYTPDYAIDEYGVRLHDTAFAGYFDAYDILPRDTVLCLLRETVSTEFQDLYADSQQMFREIMAFDLEADGE